MAYKTVATRSRFLLSYLAITPSSLTSSAPEASRAELLVASLRLEILAVTETTVTFNAYFLDENLKAQMHYEHSTFKLENGKWFYVDGVY